MARWFPKVGWKDIEHMVLVVGVLGAFAALATGDMAEHLARPNRNLVEMHSTFAALATWMYGALLVGEAALLFRLHDFTPDSFFIRFKKGALILERLLCHPIASKVIAGLALIAISVTGLLGGVMVYGLSADPVAGFVVQLLGISM